MRDGGAIQTMPGFVHGEDYSLWSDEKRAMVLSESKTRYAAYAARLEARSLLGASARAKLTQDEQDEQDE